ncbi:hypothetical protein AC1031_011174 [Aphanomyces cochlioides]|nr:hypothetical protein AC1031_011174 [Aphanomyces cochlioides]
MREGRLDGKFNIHRCDVQAFLTQSNFSITKSCEIAEASLPIRVARPWSLKCTQKLKKEQTQRPRLRLETLQKELFLAIATSDYDTIERLVAGGDMAYRENHAWHLAEELKASQAALEDIRVPLVDQMEIVNVAIADSEAKQMRVVKLIDLVEYNKAQLDHVLKKEVKLQELREALEQKVKAMIRSITTKDTVLIVSQTDPSQSTQVAIYPMGSTLQVRGSSMSDFPIVKHT